MKVNRLLLLAVLSVMPAMQSFASSGRKSIFTIDWGDGGRIGPSSETAPDIFEDESGPSAIILEEYLSKFKGQCHDCLSSVPEQIWEKGILKAGQLHREMKIIPEKYQIVSWDQLMELLKLYSLDSLETGSLTPELLESLECGETGSIELVIKLATKNITVDLQTYSEGSVQASVMVIREMTRGAYPKIKAQYSNQLSYDDFHRVMEGVLLSDFALSKQKSELKALRKGIVSAKEAGFSFFHLKSVYGYGPSPKFANPYFNCLCNGLEFNPTVMDTCLYGLKNCIQDSSYGLIIQGSHIVKKALGVEDPEYGNSFGSIVLDRNHPLTQRFLDDDLDGVDGMILDLAGAVGNNSLPLLKKGETLLLNDINLQSLFLAKKYAKKWYAPYLDNLYLSGLSAIDLPLVENSLKKIYSGYLIKYFPGKDTDTLLSKMFGALAPGGQIYLSEIQPDNRFYSEEARAHYQMHKNDSTRWPGEYHSINKKARHEVLNLVDLETTIRAFERAGFVVVDTLEYREKGAISSFGIIASKPAL